VNESAANVRARASQSGAFHAEEQFQREPRVTCDFVADCTKVPAATCVLTDTTYKATLISISFAFT